MKLLSSWGLVTVLDPREKRMKLVSPLRRQQLLFPALLLALLGSVSLVSAQDAVILQDGKQHVGKVLGASGTGVQIQIGQGTITLPMAAVKEVRMPIPVEWGAALKAFEERDIKKAFTLAKGISDKFKGLPTEWAQQATAMIGDIYIEQGDTAKAEAAYKDFQRLYPGQGSAQADLGMARLAVARKEFKDARTRIEPIAKKALEEKNPARANALLYSQAFFLMGQIEEASGNKAAALENYLRTVGVFYHDRGAAVLAQQKADALRKEQGDVFVP